MARQPHNETRTPDQLKRRAMYAAVCCSIALGLTVAIVGFLTPPASHPSSPGLLGQAPAGGLQGEAYDTRSSELREMLAVRFGPAIEEGVVSDGQAAKLAGRLSSALTEYMGGSAESYNNLMESWGGRLRDEKGWSRERLEAFWENNPERFPFVEFDFNSLELRVPPSTDDGVLLIQNEPGMAIRYQDTAWEFPGTNYLGDPLVEIRVVDVPVSSQDGTEGTLRMWWQWDTQELQWTPRRVYLVTTRDKPLPMLVF